MNLLEKFQTKSLMIFDDQVFHFNGREYSSDEAHILFMIGMKKYFNNLTFCSRLLPGINSANYRIPEQIKICPLPYYKDVLELFIKSVIYMTQIWRIIRNNINRWDILWLCWPHPVSLLILIMVKIQSYQSIPVLIVRQNLNKLVRLRYRGIKKLFAIIVINVLEWQLKLWDNETHIFTVGDEMYQKFCKSYRHVQLIRLPPLSKRDIPVINTSENKKTMLPISLLYVGRLEPEKGLPYLIQSISLLKKDNKHVHLKIIGSGPEEKELRTLTKKLDVKNEVTFYGYVKFGEPLFSYYTRADCLVLPSLSEGFPNVIMEAMAFNVAIIATKVGGIPEIIKHKRNGLLVQPGSAEAFAEAIIELIDNPELADSMRKSAKIDALSYTMEVQQELMLQDLILFFLKQ
jgi:glycosyltransferase involved in cell wall biosynthesis